MSSKSQFYTIAAESSLKNETERITASWQK